MILFFFFFFLEQVLLEHGGNPALSDEAGTSCIDVAACEGKTLVVMLLLLFFLPTSLMKKPSSSFLFALPDRCFSQVQELLRLR